MTTEPKASLSILDRITGKIGKITAVCVAVATLGTAVTKLTDLFAPAKVSVEASPTDWKSCLDAQLIHPDAVPMSQWDSMELRLKGQNNCKAKLTVYVSFKGNRIRLEPPFEPKGSDEGWEDRDLGTGAIDWQMSPPHLVNLRDNLGGRVRVNVNWVVHESDTKTKVHADTARFWLEDDNPAATNTKVTAPL